MADAARRSCIGNPYGFKPKTRNFGVDHRAWMVDTAHEGNTPGDERGFLEDVVRGLGGVRMVKHACIRGDTGEFNRALYAIQRDGAGEVSGSTRLAVCDMDEARKAERRIEAEMQRDSVCRITLEKMADMLEDANMGAQFPRNFFAMGQAFARLIRDEKLDDWFSTGPYSGLGRLALTVAEMDIDRALKEREALPELIKMARMIPLEQGVDEEKIEAQVFRDGLRLFRRHQGLDKEIRSQQAGHRDGRPGNGIRDRRS